MSKSRNKKNPDLVEDDRWKRKGGPIMQDKAEPVVCPACYGLGTVDKTHPCDVCEGEGEIWE